MNKPSPKVYEEPRQQVHMATPRLIDHSIQLFQHHIPTEYVLLGIVEFFTFMLAFYAGIEVRFYEQTTPHETLVGPIFQKAAFFAVVMSLCMIAMSTYVRSNNQHLGPIVMRMGGAMLLGVVALTLSYYIAPTFFLGRGALGLAVVIGFVCIVGIRFGFYRLAQDVRLKPRVLVLGTGKAARLIEAASERDELSGLNILGYCPINADAVNVSSDKLIPCNSSLADFSSKLHVDHIVIAVDERRNALPVEDILDCKMSGVGVMNLLTFFERETGKVRLDILEPSWLFLSDGFRQTLARRSAKRLFDIGAALTLLPVAVPLMLLVAAAIYIESMGKGPIFYRQIRVGQNGAPFEITKFRSMRTDAESDGVARWAQQNDTRITRIGALIRKTRLDELPQLLNVLVGEMSFVGPRPERPEFTSELSKKIPYYNERHRVKPGLTGWAQIRYAYGATEEDAVEKLQHDLYYVKNYSIFMDLMVLLQTAEVVILGKGAH